jgi:acetoin utilization protein AcuC
LQRAVARVAALAPAVVVLGGGGYHPWNVSRCWTGLWGRLACFEAPEPLPDAAQALLSALAPFRPRGQEIDPRWLTTLADPPRGGPVRKEIFEIVEASLAV